MAAATEIRHDWRGSTKTARILLSVDSMAALSVGLITLLITPFLADLYGWTEAFTRFMAAVNIAYGSFSGVQAWLFLRHGRLFRPAVLLLVIANAAWIGHCFAQIWYLYDTASFYGLGQLGLEAIFVGGLAALEALYVLPLTDDQS
ncbi:MAG: hypothetical protein CVV45_18415 [Spirochaetae bacterium HGW-Spirochaetae-10]|nr:MAG: hypothetical protein CVV45_18415 [Spirochaetae bacterium HGW-Spirochaetae-10]